MSDAENPAEQPAHKSGKNYRRHGARYRARRRAVDVLYEAEARDVDPVAIVEDRMALARVDITLVAPIAAYTSDIIAGVAEELNRIDDTIAGYLAENWELNRISAVDRAILRVAVWEMIFNPDVPVKTALSEAVELASQYSGASAPAYINAVLDSVVRNIDDLRQLPVGVVEVDDSDEVSFADALAQAEEESDDIDDEDEIGGLGEFFSTDDLLDFPIPAPADDAAESAEASDTPASAVVPPAASPAQPDTDVSGADTGAAQAPAVDQPGAVTTSPPPPVEPGEDHESDKPDKPDKPEASDTIDPPEIIG